MLLKKKSIYKITIIAFFILALGYWGVGLYFFPSNGMLQWSNSENLNKHNGSDAEPRWQENACLFHGKDPYHLMTQQDPPVKGIGMMNEKMPGTMPWGPFLSQFIFPGFLPFSIAVWWGMVVFTGLFSIVCVMVYKLILKKSGNSLMALLAVAITLAQYGFAPELKWLNIGGPIVGLLLIACLLDDKRHWIIIGVLLGCAMVKPQLAIMFFLPHLARRNYKIIAVSIFVVVVPWLVNSIMFSHNPITLLLDYYKISAETQVANGHAYFGLFDPLSKWFNINPLIISPFQMALCFIICTILCYKFKQAPNYLLFSIPAVFSTFWTYSNEVNLPVLALLIISIIFYLAEKDFSLKSFDAIFLCFAIIVLAAPFSSSLRLYHFPVLAPLFQRFVFLIALGIVLYKEATNNIRLT
ncbi:MAG: DUF2029 domain-containing protein [Bacteroidales bacterium]|jgi:hypothetical protein|nr:DUF2029 domain-containing protein [Bacteroidales bacterium]